MVSVCNRACLTNRGMQYNVELSEDRYLTTLAFLKNALVSSGVDLNNVTFEGQGVGFSGAPLGENSEFRYVQLIIRSS